MWCADLATAPWESGDQATYAGAVSFRILREARFIMKQTMTIFSGIAQIMNASLGSCALWRVFDVQVARYDLWHSLSDFSIALAINLKATSSS